MSIDALTHMKFCGYVTACWICLLPTPSPAAGTDTLPVPSHLLGVQEPGYAVIVEDAINLAPNLQAAPGKSLTNASEPRTLSPERLHSRSSANSTAHRFREGVHERLLLRGRRSLQAVICLAMLFTLAGAVTAEDAEPGWNRSVLPIPQPQFKGKTGLQTSQSVLDLPAEVTEPKGAPNILLNMPDDVGFGVPAPFGGPVPTSALDRIAKAGLRYDQFPTTALCSATRAALLPGRNHHSVANLFQSSTIV